MELPDADEGSVLKLVEVVSELSSNVKGEEIKGLSCCRLISARNWSDVGRLDSDISSTRPRRLSKCSFASEVELLGIPKHVISTYTESTEHVVPLAPGGGSSYIPLD